MKLKFVFDHVPEKTIFTTEFDVFTKNENS